MALEKVTLTERKYANEKDQSASPIRIATGDEMDDIFEICKDLHAENGTQYFSFSPDKVKSQLERAFTGKLAMIPCIGPPGRIEALGYVSIEQFAWSDDWHISEWFNYVLPDFRKSRHAISLLTWEKNAADRFGVVLFIGVVSNVRLGAKLRLYRRVFGGGIGAADSKRLQAMGFDVDKFLLACGCAGGYFAYKPKTLYRDRVEATGAPPH